MESKQQQQQQDSFSNKRSDRLCRIDDPKLVSEYSNRLNNPKIVNTTSDELMHRIDTF